MTDVVKFVAAPDRDDDCDCCSSDGDCSMLSIVTLEVYTGQEEWVASYDDEDYAKLVDELQGLGIYETMENTFEMPGGRKAEGFLAQLRNDSRFKVVESLYGED